MSDYLARLLDLADKAAVWREQWHGNPGFTANDVDADLIAAVDALPDSHRAAPADNTETPADSGAVNR